MNNDLSLMILFQNYVFLLHRPKLKGNASLPLLTITCHKVRHTINDTLIEIKVGIITN